MVLQRLSCKRAGGAFGRKSGEGSRPTWRARATSSEVVRVLGFASRVLEADVEARGIDDAAFLAAVRAAGDGPASF